VYFGSGCTRLTSEDQKLGAATFLRRREFATLLVLTDERERQREGGECEVERDRERGKERVSTGERRERGDRRERIIWLLTFDDVGGHEDGFLFHREELAVFDIQVVVDGREQCEENKGDESVEVVLKECDRDHDQEKHDRPHHGTSNPKRTVIFSFNISKKTFKHNIARELRQIDHRATQHRHLEEISAKGGEEKTRQADGIANGGAEEKTIEWGLIFLETCPDHRVDQTSISHGTQLSTIEEHKTKSCRIESREGEDNRELERDLKDEVISHLQWSERVRKSVRLRGKGNTNKESPKGSEE
jgi:hypothetical protein